MPKRIAICISGQPRTWERCHPSWVKLITKLEALHNATTDIFCHAWDFNTVPHKIMHQALDKGVEDKSTLNQPISQEEKDRLIDLLKPKVCLFEDESISHSSVDDLFGNIKFVPYREFYGDPVVFWAGSQFYGVMRAAHLKKKYEYENSFKYDMCLRLRYDLMLDDIQLENYVDAVNFSLPEYNVVRSCHTSAAGFSAGFPFRKLGDIFWYSDSITFDRICDFYRWFPIMGKKAFAYNENIFVENVFYYYARMLNINVKNIQGMDPKVCRLDNTLDFKKQYGLNLEYESHEII